jgi:hypothetical protein
MYRCWSALSENPGISSRDPCRTIIRSDPDYPSEDATMRFHLTYEGSLHGSSTKSPRARHKHEIRKIFHRQLKRLWEQTWLGSATYGSWEGGQSIPPSTPLNEALATLYRRGDYRYVPLVREEFSLLCSIDILFLRPGIPGTVLKSADIDARLKTIFDALRMPQNDSELGPYLAPDDGEDPFYCLIDDDKLFTHVSVATDVLLEQINGDDSDARLIIDVKISPHRVTMFNLSFAGAT